MSAECYFTAEALEEAGLPLGVGAIDYERALVLVHPELVDRVWAGVDESRSRPKPALGGD